ncbi:prolyl oligopeptidase family-domain-containing protein [Gorgonomyces haynaldii]|nr:prolyl oligopeptidase family-domain-containing protein [Gorgonomyces haynaldii]
MSYLLQSTIVHQDKFYKPDDLIPQENGVANWDCPDALYNDRFLKKLKEIKQGLTHELLLSPNRPKMNPADMDPSTLEQLKPLIDEIHASGRKIVFVDGFLLYCSQDLIDVFDIKIFMRAKLETLEQRRAERDKYITDNGEWSDPPGYYRNVVYPNYLRYNKQVFEDQSNRWLHTRTLFATTMKLILETILYFFGWDDPDILEPRPVKFRVGHRELVDDFLWIRDPKFNRTVLRHIKRENRLTDGLFQTQLKALKTRITQELSHRVAIPSSQCLELRNASSFWFEQDYLYWMDNDAYRRTKGIWVDCECFQASETSELLLDLSLLEGNLGFFEPNPFDTRWFAYSVDTVGDERFTVYIVNAETNEQAIVSHEAYYAGRWISDNGSYFIFNAVDQDTRTPLHVHSYGPVGKQAVLLNLYSEKDRSLTTDLVQTSDLQYLMIYSVGQITSNARFVVSSKTVDQPLFRWQSGVSYQIEHNRGHFYIKTNAYSKNFDLFITPNLNGWPQNRKYFLQPDDSQLIEAMTMFEEYLVVWSRRNGIRHLDYFSIHKTEHEIPKHSNELKTVLPAFADFESRIRTLYGSGCLLYSETSFLNPVTVKSLRLKDGKRAVLYQLMYDKIDAHLYQQERLTVNGVPVSVVYPKTPGPHPAYISAYGAYGGFQDPIFDTELFSFLERGILVAICHPRGDADLGMGWYEQGKMENKQNTMIDVQRCIQGLVDLNYVDRNKIGFKGRSAGGLIAGSAMNWFKDGKPILKAVVAHVPFVDPVLDMSDTSVPWTIDEWGDPANETILEAMLQYSPYQQMTGHQIPSTYVSCGIHDSRVPYWEPLKFVAKWRWILHKAELKHQHLFIRINDQGHFVSSLEENWGKTAEYAKRLMFESKKLSDLQGQVQAAEALATVASNTLDTVQDVERAIKVINQYYTIALRTEDSNKQLDALLILGYTQIRRRPPHSHERLRAQIKDLGEEEKTRIKAQILLNHAIVLKYQHQLDAAIAKMNDALLAYQKLKSDEGIAQAHENLAIHGEASSKIRENLGQDEEVIALGYKNADRLENLSKWEDAKQLLNKLKKITSDKDTLEEIDSRVAELTETTKKFAEWTKINTRLAPSNLASLSKREMYDLLGQRGQLEIDIGICKQAENTFKHQILLAKELSLTDREICALQLLVGRSIYTQNEKRHKEVIMFLQDGLRKAPLSLEQELEYNIMLADSMEEENYTYTQMNKQLEDILDIANKLKDYATQIECIERMMALRSKYRYMQDHNVMMARLRRVKELQSKSLQESSSAIDTVETQDEWQKPPLPKKKAVQLLPLESDDLESPDTQLTPPRAIPKNLDNVITILSSSPLGSSLVESEPQTVKPPSTKKITRSKTITCSPSSPRDLSQPLSFEQEIQENQYIQENIEPITAVEGLKALTPKGHKRVSIRFAHDEDKSPTIVIPYYNGPFDTPRSVKWLKEEAIKRYRTLFQKTPTIKRLKMIGQDDQTEYLFDGDLLDTVVQSKDALMMAD